MKTQKSDEQLNDVQEAFVSRDEMIKIAGMALLNQFAVPAYHPSGDYKVYLYSDFQKKEVKDVGMHVGRLCTHVLQNYSRLDEGFKLKTRTKQGTYVIRDDVDSKTAKEIVENFVMYTAQEVKVKQFAWPDETHLLTLKRLSCGPAKMSTPAWDEFLSRLDNAEAFLAWVWSIFETKHRGRQCLFLKGEVGRDGKSWILEQLSNFMGSAATTIDQNNEGRFGGGDIYDKRFLAYPDCTNPSFVNSQLFRNITGNDKVRVEKKFEGAFTTSIRARLAVGANFDPITSSETSNLSRLLIVGVTTTSAEQRSRSDVWGEGIKREMPGLLFRAREAYAKLCPTHDEIAVPNLEAHEGHLSDAVESREGRYEALFSKYFVVDRKACVSSAELHSVLMNERGLESDGRMNAFKRFIKNKRGVERVRTQQNGDRSYVFWGIRVRQDRLE